MTNEHDPTGPGMDGATTREKRRFGLTVSVLVFVVMLGLIVVVTALR